MTIRPSEHSTQSSSDINFTGLFLNKSNIAIIIILMFMASPLAIYGNNSVTAEHYATVHSISQSTSSLEPGGTVSLSTEVSLSCGPNYVIRIDYWFDGGSQQNAGYWETCGDNINKEVTVTKNSEGKLSWRAYVYTEGQVFSSHYGYTASDSKYGEVNFEYPNNPPVISNPYKPSTACARSALTLSMTATDSDDDALTAYVQKQDSSWQNAGKMTRSGDTFTKTFGETTSWLRLPRTVTLRYIVDDGEDTTSTSGFDVQIVDCTPPDIEQFGQISAPSLNDGWQLESTASDYGQISHAKLYLFDKDISTTDEIASITIQDDEMVRDETVTPATYYLTATFSGSYFDYNGQYKATIQWFDNSNNDANSSKSTGEPNIVDDSPPTHGLIQEIIEINNVNTSLFQIPLYDNALGTRESGIQNVRLEYSTDGGNNYDPEINTPVIDEGTIYNGIWNGTLKKFPFGTEVTIRFIFSDEDNTVDSTTITRISKDHNPPRFSHFYMSNYNDDPNTPEIEGPYRVDLYEVDEETSLNAYFYYRYADSNGEYSMNYQVVSMSSMEDLSGQYYAYFGDDIPIYTKYEGYIVLEDMAGNTDRTITMEEMSVDDVDPEGSFVSMTPSSNNIRQQDSVTFKVDASDQHSGVSSVIVTYCIAEPTTNCLPDTSGSTGVYSESTSTQSGGYWYVTIPADMVTYYGYTIYYRLSVSDNDHNVNDFYGTTTEPKSFTILDGYTPNNPTLMDIDPSLRSTDPFFINWTSTDFAGPGGSSGLDYSAGTMGIIYTMNSGTQYQILGAFDINPDPLGRYYYVEVPALGTDGVFNYKIFFQDQDANVYTDSSWRTLEIIEGNPPSIDATYVNNLASNYHVKSGIEYTIALDLVDDTAISSASIRVWYGNTDPLQGTYLVGDKYVPKYVSMQGPSNVTAGTYSYLMQSLSHDLIYETIYVEFIVSDVNYNSRTFQITYDVTDGKPADSYVGDIVYDIDTTNNYVDITIIDNERVSSTNEIIVWYKDDIITTTWQLPLSDSIISVDYEQLIYRVYLPDEYFTDWSKTIDFNITTTDYNNNTGTQIHYDLSLVDGYEPFIVDDKTLINSTNGEYGYIPEQDAYLYLHFDDYGDGLDYTDIANTMSVGVSASAYDGLYPDDKENLCQAYDEPVDDGTDTAGNKIEQSTDGRWYAFPCYSRWNSPMPLTTIDYVSIDGTDYIRVYLDVLPTSRSFDHPLRWGENSILHFTISFADIAGNVRTYSETGRYSQGIGSTFEAGDKFAPALTLIDPLADGPLSNSDTISIEGTVGSWDEADEIEGKLEWQYYNPYTVTTDNDGWTMIMTNTISSTSSWPGYYNISLYLGVFGVGAKIRYRVDVWDQASNLDPNHNITEWNTIEITIDTTPPTGEEYELLTFDNGQPTTFRIRAEDNTTMVNPLTFTATTNHGYRDTVSDIQKILYGDHVYYGYYEAIMNLSRIPYTANSISLEMYLTDSAGNTRLWTNIDQFVIVDVLPPEFGTIEFINDPTSLERTRLHMEATSYDAMWGGQLIDRMSMYYSTTADGTWTEVSSWQTVIHNNGWNITGTAEMPVFEPGTTVYYKYEVYDLGGNSATTFGNYTVTDDSAPYIQKTGQYLGGDTSTSEFEVYVSDPFSGIHQIYADYYVNSEYQETMLLANYSSKQMDATVEFSIPSYKAGTSVDIVITANDTDGHVGIYDFSYVVERNSDMSISNVRLLNNYKIGMTDTVTVPAEGDYISFGQEFIDPVVIVTPHHNKGISGTNLTQQAIVYNVSSYGFNIKFAEDGLSDSNGTEAMTITFLAMASGQYYIDNKFVEVGKVSYSGTSDQIELAQEFSSNPSILHNTQSSSGGLVYSRVHSITNASFMLNLEGGSDVLAQKVGYIAFEPGIANYARIESNTITSSDIPTIVNTTISRYSTPSVLASLNSVNDADPAYTMIHNATANQFAISVSESNNADGAHSSEAISYLVLNPGAIYAAVKYQETIQVETTVVSSLDIIKAELSYQVDTGEVLTTQLLNPYISDDSTFLTTLPAIETGSILSIQVNIENTAGTQATAYYILNTVNDDLTAPIINSFDLATSPVFAEGQANIEATITDNNSGIRNATIHYRQVGGNWQTTSMALQSADLYHGGFTVAAYNSNYEYYIEAFDMANNSVISTIKNFRVTEENAPTINEFGTTPSTPTNTDPTILYIDVSDTQSGISSVVANYSIDGSWSTSEMQYNGTVYIISLGILEYSTLLKYSILSIDNEGNTIETNQVSTSVTDAVDPTVNSISRTPVTVTNTDSPLVVISTADTDSGVDTVKIHYRVNEGTYTTAEMTDNGTHYTTTLPVYEYQDTIDYYITITDSDNNSHDTSIFTYVVTDAIAPVIHSITMSPSTNVNNTDSVEITANVTDTGSQLAYVTLMYQIDTGSWNYINMSLNTIYVATIPKQQYNSVVNYYIIAKDNSGLTTISSTSSYLVGDNIFPVISSITQSPEVNVNNTDTVSIQIHAHDADSGVSTVLLYYRVNGESWNILPMNNNDGVYETTIPILAYSSYVEYYSTVEDNAGLVSQSSTYNYTVQDNIDPEISAVDQSPGPIVTNTDQVVISVNATDMDSGIDHVELWFQVDGNTWNSQTMTSFDGVFTSTIPAQSFSSEIQYYVFVVDVAGLNTVSLTYNYTVQDGINPVFNSIERTPETIDNTVSPTIFANVSDTDSGINSSILYYRINGGTYIEVDMTQSNGLFVGSIPIFAYGDIIDYYVKSTDQAGNYKISAVSSYTIVDGVNPVINSINQPIVNNTDGATIMVDANDVDSGIYNVTLVYTKDGKTNHVLMDLVDGMYQVTLPVYSYNTTIDYYFIVRDQASNVLISGNYSFTVVDVINPVIVSVNQSPSTVENDDLVTITVNSTDTDSGIVNSTLYYRVDGSIYYGIAMNMSNGNYTADLPTHNYASTVEYYASITDVAGNTQISETYNYTVDDITAPTISDITNTPYPDHKTDVSVDANVVDLGSGLSSVILYYRVDAGSWQSVVMIEQSTPGQYYASIPAQKNGATVDYYIIATDNIYLTTQSLQYTYYVTSSGGGSASYSQQPGVASTINLLFLLTPVFLGIIAMVYIIKNDPFGYKDQL